MSRKRRYADSSSYGNGEIQDVFLRSDYFLSSTVTVVAMPGSRGIVVHAYKIARGPDVTRNALCYRLGPLFLRGIRPGMCRNSEIVRPTLPTPQAAYQVKNRRLT